MPHAKSSKTKKKKGGGSKSSSRRGDGSKSPRRNRGPLDLEAGRTPTVKALKTRLLSMPKGTLLLSLSGVLNVILAALLVMDVSGSSGIMCATPPMQVVAAVRCACGLLARKALPMRCCRSPSFSHTPPLTYHYTHPPHTRAALGWVARGRLPHLHAQVPAAKVPTMQDAGAVESEVWLHAATACSACVSGQNSPHAREVVVRERPLGLDHR